MKIMTNSFVTTKTSNLSWKGTSIRWIISAMILVQPATIITAELSSNTNSNAIDLLRQSTCTLNCKNNGTCQYITDDTNELQRMMQSGRMIMHCSCPDNYIGMGCEQARPMCNVQTMKCPNHRPCERSITTTTTTSDSLEYHCDCSVADQISTRTSAFCRKTYTEYCTSSNDIRINPIIFFCTNGGKCKGDLLSAQLAPGNTSINELYEYDGCLCPPEYYGTHCEFMYPNTSSILSNGNNPVPPSSSSTIAPTFTSSSDSSELQTINPSTTDDDGTDESIEDLINNFTNQTRNNVNSTNNELSKSEQQHQILRIVLCSIVIALFIVGVSIYFIRYRHHLKHKRFRLLQKTFTPRNTNDDENDENEKYHPSSPSVTGGSVASSSISITSSYTGRRTVKTGSKSRRMMMVEHQEYDTDATTLATPTEGLLVLTPTNTQRILKQSFQFRKNIKNSSNSSTGNRTASAQSPYITDDTDIVSITNDASYHRRCLPLTATNAATESFVVDDDDDNKESETTNIIGSEHPHDGLWVFDGNNHDNMNDVNCTQNQFRTMQNHSVVPLKQQPTTSPTKSWIVSLLPNRAINFTEIGQQQQQHHTSTTASAATILKYNNVDRTSTYSNSTTTNKNNIYLVDDDDDDNNNVVATSNATNGNTTRYLDKFVEHL